MNKTSVPVAHARFVGKDFDPYQISFTAFIAVIFLLAAKFGRQISL